MAQWEEHWPGTQTADVSVGPFSGHQSMLMVPGHPPPVMFPPQRTGQAPGSITKGTGACPHPSQLPRVPAARVTARATRDMQCHREKEGSIVASLSKGLHTTWQGTATCWRCHSWRQGMMAHMGVPGVPTGSSCHQGTRILCEASVGACDCLSISLDAAMSRNSSGPWPIDGRQILGLSCKTVVSHGLPALGAGGTVLSLPAKARAGLKACGGHWVVPAQPRWSGSPPSRLRLTCLVPALTASHPRDTCTWLHSALLSCFPACPCSAFILE